MGKKKTRTVHVGGVEWHYVIERHEIRIYEPGTKQIKARVNPLDVMTNSASKREIQPSTIKEYIENELT